MNDHPNHGLDPLHYCINLVGEESAEICKDVSKVLRFGLFDRHPHSGETVFQILQNELTDLMGAVRLLNRELERKGLPPLELDDEEAIQKKIAKVHHYARRSIERGTLTAPLVDMDSQHGH